MLAEMAYHDQRIPQQGRRVGEILSCDIGRGPMDSLKNCAFIAQVRAGHKSQPTDKSGAQIRENISVEIFHHQHIVLVRIHHQLHAGVVDDVFAVSDLGIIFRYVAAAAQEQAIGQLHDVRFVDGMNFLALILTRIGKCEFGNPRGSFLSNNLQAFDNAGHHFMLQARVKTLCVFADDDQVNIRIARGNVRQVPDGAEICVQIEFLAEGDVDARKASAYRRGDRALESDAGSFNRLGQFLGDILAQLFVGFGTDREGLPFKLHPSRFQDAYGRLRYFGPDSISGDQSYFMSHEYLSSKT